MTKANITDTIKVSPYFIAAYVYGLHKLKSPKHFYFSWKTILKSTITVLFSRPSPLVHVR